MVDKPTSDSLVVVWTEFARKQLGEIYQYYKSEVSETIAKNIRTRIFLAIKPLEAFPRLGAVEHNLEGMEVEFRYLVSDNYKIIYWCQNNDSTTIVYISDIFDCRQDPQEMKRIMD